MAADWLTDVCTQCIHTVAGSLPVIGHVGVAFIYLHLALRGRCILDCGSWLSFLSGSGLRALKFKLNVPVAAHWFVSMPLTPSISSTLQMRGRSVLDAPVGCLLPAGNCTRPFAPGIQVAFLLRLLVEATGLLCVALL